MCASTVKNHYPTLGLFATLEPCFVFKMKLDSFRCPRLLTPTLLQQQSQHEKSYRKGTPLSFRKAEERALLSAIPEGMRGHERMGRGVRAGVVGVGAGRGDSRVSSEERRQETVRESPGQVADSGGEALRRDAAQTAGTDTATMTTYQSQF